MMEGIFLVLVIAWFVYWFYVEYRDCTHTEKKQRHLVRLKIILVYVGAHFILYIWCARNY